MSDGSHIQDPGLGWEPWESTYILLRRLHRASSVLHLSAHVLPGEFNNPEKLQLAQFDQLSSACVPRGFFFFFTFYLTCRKPTSMRFYSLLKPGDFSSILLFYETLIKVWNKMWWIPTKLNFFVYCSLVEVAGHYLHQII